MEQGTEEDEELKAPAGVERVEQYAGLSPKEARENMDRL